VPSDRGTFGGILRAVDILELFDHLDSDRKALFDRDGSDKAGSPDGLQGALDSLESVGGVFSPWFEQSRADFRIGLHTTFEPLRRIARGSLLGLDPKIVLDGIDDLIPEKLAVVDPDGDRIGQLRFFIERNRRDQEFRLLEIRTAREAASGSKSGDEPRANPGTDRCALEKIPSVLTRHELGSCCGLGFDTP